MVEESEDKGFMMHHSTLTEITKIQDTIKRYRDIEI